MFLCEILTEQQQQAPPPQPEQSIQQVGYIDQPTDDDYDPELDTDGSEEMDQNVVPFQEILPLKRYYLIQRLKNFNAQLCAANIKNTDLEIILKFVNNISYNSLVDRKSVV